MRLFKKIIVSFSIYLYSSKKRINFTESSLSEIKEAITRQDILDLYNDGAIKIREISGRRKIVRRKHRRRRGIG